MLDEAMAFLGAAAVFGIQVIAVCGGRGILLTHWPQLQVALQCVGGGCLPYLGWQLLRRHGTGTDGAGGLDTFWEAASLQYLNPRTWVMSVATATLLLPLQLEQLLADGYAPTI